MLYEYQPTRKAAEFSAFQVGSTRMAMLATTACLKTSGWLTIGRTCSENLMRR